MSDDAARGAQPGTEAQEPTTEAGRRFMAKWTEGSDYAFGRDMLDVILAIEAEARQQGREMLDVDQFRKVVIGTLNNNGWSVYQTSGSWVDRRVVADALRAALAQADHD